MLDSNPASTTILQFSLHATTGRFFFSAQTPGRPCRLRSAATGSGDHGSRGPRQDHPLGRPSVLAHCR